MSNHIVFGPDDNNTLGIVRSLGEKGIFPCVIAIKEPIVTIKYSKFTKEVFFVDSIEKGYELMISNYGNDTGSINYVYVGSDAIEAYLDHRYDSLIERFSFFNAGGKGIVTKYMNKDIVSNCAKQHGLNILKNWNVKKGEIPDDLEYPIFTKTISPLSGAWKKDYYICNNEKELVEAYKKIKSDRLLLQKFIYKKNECCFLGLSIASEVLVTVEANFSYNIDGAYSSHLIINPPQKKELIKAIENMLKEIGYTGLFSAEFLIDENDEYYFSEINFRNDGWSYASTFAGLSLPYIWYKSMEEGKINNSYINPNFNSFYAVGEWMDYKNRVRNGDVSLIRWLKIIIQTECKCNLGRNDIMPVIMFFFNGGKMYLKRLIGGLQGESIKKT